MVTAASPQATLNISCPEVPAVTGDVGRVFAPSCDVRNQIDGLSRSFTREPTRSLSQ